MSSTEKVDDKLTDELAKNGELGLAYAIQRVKNANHKTKENKYEIDELKLKLVKANGLNRKLELQIDELTTKLDKASTWAIEAEKRLKKLESNG